MADFLDKSDSDGETKSWDYIIYQGDGCCFGVGVTVQRIPLH